MLKRIWKFVLPSKPHAKTVHPDVLGFAPTSTQVVFQWKRWRWQRKWKQVVGEYFQPKRGHYRAFRETVWNLPEGYEDAENGVFLAPGEYFKFEYLGLVDTSQYVPRTKKEKKSTKQESTEPG